MAKLSVIILTYDMQREAPRTLQSVLPPMQREVSGEDYDVVVIDNGADPPFGARYRYCHGRAAHFL